MRHTEPDYYHGAPSLGCLIALALVASLAVVCYGAWHLGELTIQLIRNHF